MITKGVDIDNVVIPEFPLVGFIYDDGIRILLEIVEYALKKGWRMPEERTFYGTTKKNFLKYYLEIIREFKQGENWYLNYDKIKKWAEGFPPKEWVPTKEGDKEQSIFLAKQFLLHYTTKKVVNERWFKEWLTHSICLLDSLKAKRAVLTEIVNEKIKAMEDGKEDSVENGKLPKLLACEEKKSAEELLKDVDSIISVYEESFKHFLFEPVPAVKKSWEIETSLHTEAAFYGQLVKFSLEVVEYLRSHKDVKASSFIVRLKKCKSIYLVATTIFKNYDSGKLYKQHRGAALAFIKQGFSKIIDEGIFESWFNTKISSFTNILERKIRRDNKAHKESTALPINNGTSYPLDFWPRLIHKCNC
jgi:hypothetical protein